MRQITKQPVNPGLFGCPWFVDLAHRNRSDFCGVCDRDAHRGPQKSQRFPRQEKAMLQCDLRVRWKVASDLRFRAAISEPKTPSLCGISGDLAPSTRKSLAIRIVRFWCAKFVDQRETKGRQLKGNIVSDFFTLFQHFSPRTFPFKTKGFSSRRRKEKKR